MIPQIRCYVDAGVCITTQKADRHMLGGVDLSVFFSLSD